jgi:hypothetical protein
MIVDGNPEHEEEEEDDSSWYRDENYTMEDWSYAMLNEDGTSGYIDWVISKYESDDLEVPQRVLDQVMTAEELGLAPDNTAPVTDKYRSRYPLEDWLREVEDFDTRVGYETWLWTQVQHDDEWLEYERQVVAAEDRAGKLEKSTSAVVAPSNRPRF